MKEHVAEHVITSRLLILQSKRLLLSSAERQATLYGSERLRDRVERLRGESELARHAYASILLKVGSPEHPDYWSVAYRRLIDLGNELSHKLTEASETAAPREREAIATDVELVDELVQGWTASMRKRVSAA